MPSSTSIFDLLSENVINFVRMWLLFLKKKSNVNVRKTIFYQKQGSLRMRNGKYFWEEI